MNKVFQIGNLVRDPEVRTTPGGASVATFRIAVQRKFKDQSGEKVSDFFDIVAWRQLADLCAKYLSKGKKIAVAGELQTRSYEAKDGSKRYITEIIADEIEFLSPRGDATPNTTESEPKKSYRAEPVVKQDDGMIEVEPDDDQLPF